MTDTDGLVTEAREIIAGLSFGRSAVVMQGLLAALDALRQERDALQAQLTAARADLQTLARGFLAFRGLAVLNESADPAVLNTWLPGIDAATRIAEDAALPPTPEET